MDIKQITNAAPDWTGVEYSSICPFNSHNSRILLIKRDHFGLWDGSGNFLQDLTTISAGSKPKWSRTDPLTFYFIRGNMLMRWTNGVEFIVKRFLEYIMFTPDGVDGVNGKGKSDISEDNRHLVLRGIRPDGVHEIFLFDIVNVAKSPVFATTGPYNNLFVTPDNNVIVTWSVHGPDRFNGVELFDGQMVFQRQVARSDGHLDICRDASGDEVMVWTNSNEPNPQTFTNCQNGIVKVRLRDGHQTCLQTLDWSLAVDIAARRDWALVSTYSTNPTPPATPYTNKILKVMLDGSGTVVVGDHHSIATYYNAQPKASPSRDGTRFVFSSNSGKTDVADYCDVFLAMLDGAAIPAPVVIPPVAVPPVIVPPTPVPVTVETRIDYSAYVGKSEFVLKPRPDGAVDIFERKLKQ